MQLDCYYIFIKHNIFKLIKAVKELLTYLQTYVQKYKLYTNMHFFVRNKIKKYCGNRIRKNEEITNSYSQSYINDEFNFMQFDKQRIIRIGLFPFASFPISYFLK